MNKKILYGIVLILLFSFGCTSQISQEGGEIETIYEVFESDVNNDGLIDSTTYIFNEIEYNETNIQKIIIIKPKFDLTKIEAKIEDAKGDRYYFENLTIEELYVNLNNFNNKRSNEISITGEAQCKQYLGLGREDLPCISISSCSKACMGAPLCAYIYQFVGEPFAQDLYELNNGFTNMDKYILELNSILKSMEDTENNLNKQKIEEMVGKIEQISILGSEINENPIINKNVYYLCNRINYDNYELQSMLDKISKNLKTEYYGDSFKTEITKTDLKIEFVEYKVFLQINEKSERSFSTITISDIIPSDLDIDINSLKVSSNFSSINTTIPLVNWEINKAGSGELQSFMTYSFTSKKLVDREWIENNIKTPYVSVKAFSFGAAPLTIGVLIFINSIFGFFFNFSNYFIALALTGALIIIVLRIMERFINLIWNIIIETSKRNNFSKIKTKWLGKANPNFKQYLILGICLFIFGIILAFITPNTIQEKIIILETIGHNLMLEPIGGLSVLLILFGVISIYFSIEDVIKGSFLKSGYYESPETIVKKTNLENLKNLEQKIEEVGEKIKQALEQKIDVSEEQDLIYSIPISRINELIQKNDQKTAKAVIEQSINRCEFNIGTIDKKIQTAMDIWQNWENKFDKILKEKGEIRKEMLIDIPRTWRSWALEKYLIENLDKNLIIENGILKRMEVKTFKKKGIMDILNNLIDEKIKKAGIFGIDGKIMASTLDKNINNSIVSLMLSRMIKSIKIVETRAKTGNTEYLVAKSGKHLIFVRPANSGNLILFCITESITSLKTLEELTDHTIKELNELYP